jgi:hypothetical protein
MSDIERRLKELGERAGSIGGITPPASLPRRARIRRVATALGAVSLLAIAGVGGYFGVRNLGEPAYRLAQADVLSLAAAATEQQGSAKATFEMSMRFESEEFSADTDMTGTGELDFRARAAHMVMEVTGMPFGEPGGAASGGVESIYLDGVQYTRETSSGSEGQWRKIELPEGSSNSIMALPGTDQGDPSQFIDSLRTVSGDIQDLGTESLDGVVVTHYRAILDKDRMLDSISAADSDHDLEEQMESIEFEPMDVWVDDAGLLRKMRFAVAASGEPVPSQRFSMHMTMSMSLYDYGVPVDITAPDPSEVSSSESVIDEQMSDLPGTTTAEFESSESRMVQVFGSEGPSGPWLMVPAGEETVGMLCVAKVPADTRMVEVIDETNSRAVARVETRRSDGSSDDGFGCLDDFKTSEARAILARATDYTLKIISRSGAETIVELEQVAGH